MLIDRSSFAHNLSLLIHEQNCDFLARRADIRIKHAKAYVCLQFGVSSSVAFTAAFLDSCSNELWFRTGVNLLQHKGLDAKILEKLSIVFQRLSKIK